MRFDIDGENGHDPWQLRGHLPNTDLLVWEDGSAEGERAERIAAHLAVCQVCRARLEENREVGRLIRQRFPLPADPEERARRLRELLDDLGRDLEPGTVPER